MSDTPDEPVDHDEAQNAAEPTGQEPSAPSAGESSESPVEVSTADTSSHGVDAEAEAESPSQAKRNKLIARVRRAGFIILILVLAFFLVGVMLSRAFEASATHEIDTASVACARQLIETPKRWTEWTTFDADGEAPDYTYSGPDRGQGAIMTWETERSGGRLEIGECSEQSVKFDLSLPSRGRLARGAITLQPSSRAGKTELRWTEQGELPPIVGGYLRALVESSLEGHFQSSLRRLGEVCQAQGALVPSTGEAAPAEAAPVEAAPAEANINTPNDEGQPGQNVNMEGSP